jgi:hypothetical protein
MSSYSLNKLITISKYQTTDGKIFVDEDSAYDHQRTLDFLSHIRSIPELEGVGDILEFLDDNKEAVLAYYGYDGDE